MLFGILEDAFFPPGLRGNDTSVISNYFGMIVSCSVGYMDRVAFCICWVIGICLGGRYICFILVNVLFPRGEALISFVFFCFCCVIYVSVINVYLCMVTVLQRWLSAFFLQYTVDILTR